MKKEMNLMEHVVYQFYQELNEFINKEIQPYPLEIRKYTDEYYVIGDNLKKLGEVSLMHGGDRNSKFVFIIQIRKPYIVSVVEWKNEVFPQEKIFTFVNQKIVSLLQENSFQGICDIRFGRSRETLKDRHVFGYFYQSLLSMIESIPNINERMGPDGDFQYNGGKCVGLFQIEITSSGLILKKRKETYERTIQSIEDWEELYRVLQEKEEELIAVKEKINQYIHDVPHAKWEHSDCLTISRETIFVHLQVIVVNGEFQYIFRINPYQEIICKDINEVFQSIKQRIDAYK